MSVNASADDDCSCFTKLCGENLSQTDYRPEHYRRLGKISRDKPRDKRCPFLVVLRNEQAAATLLFVTKDLGKSDDEYVKQNVFINRDLTRAEAELDYKKRVARRQRAQS